MSHDSFLQLMTLEFLSPATSPNATPRHITRCSRWNSSSEQAPHVWNCTTMGPLHHEPALALVSAVPSSCYAIVRYSSSHRGKMTLLNRLLGFFYASNQTVVLIMIEPLNYVGDCISISRSNTPQQANLHVEKAGALGAQVTRPEIAR